MSGGRADPDHPGQGGRAATSTVAGLLDESAEDLYENAPCGYLSALPDGTIAKINGTLLGWLGYSRDELVGRRRFADLLTAGGRIYNETHLVPLLRMQGQVGGIALELLAADGTRLPVLVTSVVRSGDAGKAEFIRTTIFDARDRRAYERELLQARKEAEHERERLQRLVSTLQRSLLPPALPAVPGLETGAYYHPASLDEVGGDFYDLFPVGGGRWCLFLGDVCGKGARAAIVTSLIRYTLRAAAVSDPSPVPVLTTLNRVLHEECLRDERSFCTAIFGLLTPRDDGFTLTVAGGGHPAPLVMRADGTAGYLRMPGGQMIGTWHDAVFASTTIGLCPGDTLLLYTDGLTEARTAGGRYGEEGLLSLGAGLAPASATAAVTAATDLLSSFGDGLDDDAAILAVSVTAGPGQRAGAAGAQADEFALRSLSDI